MQLEDCINYQLTVTQNAVSSRFRSMLAPYQVTPSQYGLLHCLWDEDGQSPTRLAQALCLDTSTMTGLLDRMEAKGLLVREYSTEDRRAVAIYATELGRSLRSPITRAIENANRAVLHGLTAEEKAVLRRCLAVLYANAQHTDTEE